MMFQQWKLQYRNLSQLKTFFLSDVSDRQQQQAIGMKL